MSSKVEKDDADTGAGCQPMDIDDDNNAPSGLLQKSSPEKKEPLDKIPVSKFSPIALKMLEAIWGPESLFLSRPPIIRIVHPPPPNGTATAPVLPPRPRTPPPSCSTSVPTTKEYPVEEYSEEEEDEAPYKKKKIGV